MGIEGQGREIVGNGPFFPSSPYHSSQARGDQELSQDKKESDCCVTILSADENPMESTMSALSVGLLAF